jgi:hypothetical protein
MLIQDFFKDLDRFKTKKDNQELLDLVDKTLPGSNELPDWLNNLHTIFELMNHPQELNHNIDNATRAYNEAMKNIEE